MFVLLAIVQFVLLSLSLVTICISWDSLFGSSAFQQNTSLLARLERGFARQRSIESLQETLTMVEAALFQALEVLTQTKNQTLTKQVQALAENARGGWQRRRQAVGPP